MATILSNIECPAVIINGTEDHMHVLCFLSRKARVMDVVKDAKTETSKWVKKQSAGISSFAWQAGYGVFFVSESNLVQARLYIEHQTEHHRRMSYQDEFRELCRRHGVELNEAYAWD